MRIKLLAGLFVAALGLSACGDTPLEQGVFGAGAGTGVAALAGADLATGAVLGAVGSVAYCQYYERANCN